MNFTAFSARLKFPGFVQMVAVLAIVLMTAMVAFFLFTKSPQRFTFVAEYHPVSDPGAAWFNMRFGGTGGYAEYEETNKLVLTGRRLQFLEPSRSTRNWGYVTLSVTGFQAPAEKVYSDRFAWVADEGGFHFRELNENGLEVAFAGLSSESPIKIETKIEKGTRFLIGDLRGLQNIVGSASHVIVVRLPYEDGAPNVKFQVEPTEFKPTAVSLIRSNDPISSGKGDLAHYTGEILPMNDPIRGVTNIRFGTTLDFRPDEAKDKAFALILSLEGSGDATEELFVVAPLEKMIANRSKGSLTVGSKRFSIEGADEVTIDEASSQVRISSIDKTLEAVGLSSDLELNGEQLVRSRFEELHPVLQGALGAGVVSTFGILIKALFEPLAEFLRSWPIGKKKEDHDQFT